MKGWVRIIYVVSPGESGRGLKQLADICNRREHLYRPAL